MDLGESSMDPKASCVDPNKSRGGASSGVSGGDSSQEQSQRTKEKQFDHSDDTSGLGLQDARQHVAHPRTSDGSGGITIESLEELSNVIKLGNLSQVKKIELYYEDTRSGDFTLADALASGQMSALENLSLFSTRLTEDHSELIGNALTSRKFPSLTCIILLGDKIGARGVEALGRAIRSGNLEKLAYLFLNQASINDDGMATLATAFQHGDASVLPNLKLLDLESNPFTQVGLQSLAEALKSGRLDSLQNLGLSSSSNCSEQGANALVSALTLNNRLTVDVRFEWHQFPDLDLRRRQLRKRNLRHKDILAGLLDSPKVPASVGKIYLCGSPQVGKTTLARTLQRGFLKALFTGETRPHVEQRTRGIDVAKFSSKGAKRKENPITLFVWDMAGQPDYHLVHNAFFPDLSFSEGKATTFVIVCSSKNLDEAKEQLEYWLRYIASSCHKSTKWFRHVFVVLNNIGGQKIVQEYAPDWKILLQDQKDKFSGILDVHTNPFVVDVRRRRKVNGLKICLLQHSGNLLKDEKVPEMCQIIQANLTAWSATWKEFPVLDWEKFVHEVQGIEPCPQQIIEAATKYLNEVGVIIYIDKDFPRHWGIPYRRLLVLDVNWFCKEIIGNIFLSEDMVNQRDCNLLFRGKVDETTGSISISDFKKFFKSRWSDENFDHLISILLWLGLCHKGKEENVFIPSLIDKNGKPGDVWQPQSAYETGEDQWVMGFSIEHKKSEITLAPMSLWHKFQVQLAQTPKFNGEVLDNDFVAGKDFMTFTVDYMNVLIEVDASEDIPTFNEISIFVKPKFRKDELDANERKQCQVNLANYLVDILLELWDDICGGVQYVQKVVWPWPASQSRPEYILDRNVEVAQVIKLVQMHGMGRKMQWTVGHDSAITEDQLLSTNDKRNVIKSVESDLSILREGMREAVNLGIYPPELTEESIVPLDGSDVATHAKKALTERVSSEESGGASDEMEGAPQPMSPNTHRILKAVKEVGGKVDEVGEKVDKVSQKLNDVENMLREGFSEVLNEQKKLLRKLQDTERFFKEDKDRTCPNLIYLGEKDSGVWATLKQALSLSVYVRLRFACEAKYNSYRPHEVTNQQGVDVSALKPSLKKIAPWLKVSLTVLLISAKIGANFVAPGVGLIVSKFQQWQEASSLSEGMEWATGFLKAELDKLMIEGMGLDGNGSLWNPRDVYGESREAITNLIGKLTTETYEEKFRLRKVCLTYSDGSLHGVVWICTECLRNFRELNLASEV